MSNDTFLNTQKWAAIKLARKTGQMRFVVLAENGSVDVLNPKNTVLAEGSTILFVGFKTSNVPLLIEEGLLIPQV